jgi:GNAT superfamily N-acetyltransferase
VVIQRSILTQNLRTNLVELKKTVMEFTIRTAKETELALLGAIERSASELFRDTPFEKEVEAEVLPIDFLIEHHNEGRVWVAADPTDAPFGFAVAGVIEDEAFLYEVSVVPDRTRRGAGKRLVEAVRYWAVEKGFSSLRLSTYKDIPWNLPFYEKLGFDLLDDAHLGKGLLEIKETEKANGLDVSARVFMTLDLRPPAEKEPPPRFSLRRAETRDLGTIALLRQRGTDLSSISPLHPENSYQGLYAAVAKQQVSGNLWAVVNADDITVGASYAIIVNGIPHIEDICAEPSVGRADVGDLVISSFVGQAAEAGFPAITARVRRGLPWSLPLFQRHGFRIMQDNEVSTGLRSISTPLSDHPDQSYKDMFVIRSFWDFRFG